MFRVKGPLNCSPWVPRRVSKEAFCRGLYGLHEFTRVLPGLRFLSNLHLWGVFSRSSTIPQLRNIYHTYGRIPDLTSGILLN